MFIHMSVHSPKPGKEADLAASMHRYAAALEGAPGLVRVDTFRDQSSGRLVGIAQWETHEAMEAWVHKAREAVKDDPFGEWETEEPEGFRLTKL